MIKERLLKDSRRLKVEVSSLQKEHLAIDSALHAKIGEKTQLVLVSIALPALICLSVRSGASLLLCSFILYNSFSFCFGLSLSSHVSFLFFLLFRCL